MLNTENHSNFDSYGYAEEEDDDDTLSFRDLPILGDDDHEINNNSILKKIPSLSSPHEDPFEFFNQLLFQEPSPSTPRVAILKQKEADQEAIVKLSASSSSSSSNSSHRNSNSYYRNNSSSSISNVQTVNITSLTSMSSKLRWIMFMFGPVKFNPEMELSSIKMRQSKRSLKDNYVSQAAAAGEIAIATTNSGGAGRREWGLLRSFSRYRSRAAARSCGCFS